MQTKICAREDCELAGTTGLPHLTLPSNVIVEYSNTYVNGTYYKNQSFPS